MDKTPLRLFFSTEYIENSRGVQLVSIGIVSEDGREYYAISKEFDVEAAWKDDAVRENILSEISDHFGIPWNIADFKKEVDRVGKTKNEMAIEILWFIHEKKKKEVDFANQVAKLVQSNSAIFYDLSKLLIPAFLQDNPFLYLHPKQVEFWSYAGADCWRNLYRLFGDMLTATPACFPITYSELDTLRMMEGITKEWMKEHIDMPIYPHYSLANARWCRMFYKKLTKHKIPRRLLIYDYSGEGRNETIKR